MERKRRWLTIALWLLTAALVGWVLRTVPLVDIMQQFRQLNARELALLAGINVLVIATFAARWWVILRSQGFRVGFLPVTLYRLASFGVSYLTPGPQFGGEPVQVLLLTKRHAVPTEAAIASVTLEKAIELGINGFVIFGGAIFVFQSGMVPSFGLGGVAGAFALMLVPTGFLGALWVGQRPLSPLLGSLPARPWLTKLRDTISHTEGEIIRVCKERRQAVGWAALVSGISWVFVIAEYGMALRFLGLTLPLNEVVALVLAARVAILVPTPGGIGAVEASQLLVMSALGYDPAVGLGVSVLIRARDVVFGLIGILVALGTHTLDTNTQPSVQHQEKS